MAQTKKVIIIFKNNSKEIIDYSKESCFINVFPKDGVLFLEKKIFGLTDFKKYVSTRLIPLDKIADVEYQTVDNEELFSQFINDDDIDIQSVLENVMSHYNYTDSGHTHNNSLWLKTPDCRATQHIINFSTSTYLNKEMTKLVNTFFETQRKNNLSEIIKVLEQKSIKAIVNTVSKEEEYLYGHEDYRTIDLDEYNQPKIERIKNRELFDYLNNTIYFQ